MPSPLTGQATSVDVNTATGLSATPIGCAVFSIRAPAGNGGPVAIGGKTVTLATGYLLDPGGEITYTRSTQNAENRAELAPSDFYVSGNAGDKVSWLASP